MAWEQVVQVVGALLLLAGFAGVQTGRMPPNGLPSLLLNAAGSGVLAVLAWRGSDWGFLLLEGVWCLVALTGIARLAARSRGRDQSRGDRETA